MNIKNLVSEFETYVRYRISKNASKEEQRLLDAVSCELARQPNSPEHTAQRLRDVISGEGDQRPQTCIGIPPALLGEAVKGLEDHWDNAERHRQRLNSVFAERDHWKGVAERRTGLREELELELFGEVLPVASDAGEAVYLRALAEIRRLKAAAG